jgi:hypothetical protein
MARSVGNFRFTLNKLIDHAIGRCKIPRTQIAGEHQIIARECLSLLFAELSNKGVPLWCQERVILPLYQQEAVVELPPGTVDILPGSAFLRYMTRVGGTYASSAGGTPASAGDGDLRTSLTQTTINGSVIVSFVTPTVVNQVGIMANGDQWHNLVFEASNDDLTYTVLQTIAAPFGEHQTLYQDARWAWYEVASPPTEGALFFRVRETGGGVLDLRELYLGTAPIDIPMARLNREQYYTLPNKTAPSRPLQFWLSRDLNEAENFAERPKMYLWPVPGGESVFSCLVLVRHRYIADIGDFNASIELPVRWYGALCWSLADLAAAELPEVPPDREAYLQGRASQAMGEALDEERDNSPIQIQADISAYTR